MPIKIKQLEAIKQEVLSGHCSCPAEKWWRIGTGWDDDWDILRRMVLSVVYEPAASSAPGN